MVYQNKSMMYLEHSLEQLQLIQKNQSEALDELATKLSESETRDNLTLSQLQKQIDDSTEIVALTAHLKSGATTSGIMMFDNVKLSVGYNNLLAYKNTGKFICEKSGLYLISASIIAEANSAYYYLYINNKMITSTYISYNSNNPSSTAHTGTITIALQLNHNDSVWINNGGGTKITNGYWSTLTIVKVK